MPKINQQAFPTTAMRRILAPERASGLSTSMSEAALVREVWVGFVEVVHRPGAGVLLDRNGAYVNVLALAADVLEYAEQVRAALRDAGFDVVAMEDVEPLSRRRERYALQQDLLTLAQDVETSGLVRFGTFHTWTAED
jgi:hypothetical protein